MERLRSFSPSEPERMVAEVAAIDPSTITSQLIRAQSAARKWSLTPAMERAASIDHLAAALAGAAAELEDLLVEEVGKPRVEAREEVGRASGLLRYYATQTLDPEGETYPPEPGSDLLYTRRVPLGVVGLITPWNFPLAIPIWKCAPALAFGNAVILKPSPLAVGVAERLRTLANEALPDGVFQVAYGGAAVAQALIRAVDGVSFTGSTRVGREVARVAVDSGVPVQAELGSNNPAIVLPSAPKGTVATIARAACAFGGQKCTATSRTIVVGRSSGFAEELVDEVERLVVGDPSDEATVVGPLITAAACDRADAALRQAAEAGDIILPRSEAPFEGGHYWTPAVVLANKKTSPLLPAEIFAPLVSVVEATDVEEALKLANGHEHGLVAGLYTGDLREALEVAERLHAGMVKVNRPTTGVAYYAPFGGGKGSSIGVREQGKVARDFYTTTRTVTIGTAP